jgi:hypothetical protein
MKAYDLVNWDFIFYCLAAIGVPARFVSWVRECITNPTFTLALKGTLVGFFRGGRGLRKGDPISPSLCPRHGSPLTDFS